MFGLTPKGHPDSRRLVFHDSFPVNSYPLRKDWNISELDVKEWGEGIIQKESYTFMKVEGEGIYEIPVGPVHAGIIEPGHFRFSAVGETIFFLEIRLGYVHRGVERAARGLSPAALVVLAERISGTASVAHSVAAARGAQHGARG